MYKIDSDFEMLIYKYIIYNINYYDPPPSQLMLYIVTGFKDGNMLQVTISTQAT